MKKIIKVFAVAVIAIAGLSACQKVEFNGVVTDHDGAIRTMQLIVNSDTRLALADESGILTRQFEVGDTLLGCVKVSDAYKSFSFKVASAEKGTGAVVYTIEKISGETGVPSAETTTNLHFFYAPGKAASAFAADSISVSIATQKQARIPSVMYGSAKLIDGKCNINFVPVTTTIALKDYTIKDLNDQPVTGYSFTKASISNVVTSGYFKMADDEVSFVPATATATATLTATEQFTGGPIYFSSFANPTPAKLTVTAKSVTVGEDAVGNPTFTTPNAVELKANGYGVISNVDLKAEAVASVGTKLFPSLEAVFEEVGMSTSDVEVKLLKDIDNDVAHTVYNTSGRKITLNFNDFVINSTASPTITVETDMDFVDGPNGTGGITAKSRAITCSTENLVVNIKGGTYRGAYQYGTIRFYGKDSELNISGNTKVYATGANYAINMGYTGTSTGSVANISGNVYMESENNAAFKNQYGKTTITGGTFVGKQAILTGTYASEYVNVEGGYFFSTNPDTLMSGSGLTGRLSSGYCNVKPFDNLVADGKEISDISASPVVKDGRTYNFTFVESTKSVVEVNGKGYASFASAFEDAVMYNGSESKVTIKLLDDCTVTESLDFTNLYGKEMTLDLNNHVMSSAGVWGLITTSEVLNITDSSAEKGGVITGNKSRQLYVGDEGIINVSDCTIETSYSWQYTYIDTSVVVVHGTSVANGKGEINFNHARLRSKNLASTTTLSACYYGTIRIIDSEFNAGQSSSSGASYYCLKTSSGAKVTIENSTLVSCGTASGSVIRLSGKNSANIQITNSYLCGKTAILVTSTAGYEEVVTLNSGWFNLDIPTGFPKIKIADGKAWSACDPAVVKTVDGTDYTFPYKVD